jgi:hypothetical protein
MVKYNERIPELVIQMSVSISLVAQWTVSRAVCCKCGQKSWSVVLTTKVSQVDLLRQAPGHEVS